MPSRQKIFLAAFFTPNPPEGGLSKVPFRGFRGGSQICFVINEIKPYFASYINAI
jgi:hypothetical protein